MMWRSPLTADRIEVLYLRTQDIHADSLADMQSQVTSEEQTRAARFLFAEDRIAFTVGRILVRKALSEHFDKRSQGWQFESNPYGKLSFKPANGAEELHFNISHCAGLVTAAFALKREVGLDVECVDRAQADMETAQSCFSAEELHMLEALDETLRRRAILSLWTLKEAYVKARGLGVSIPFQDFGFSVDPIRIAFSDRIADHPDNWSFWQQFVPSSHLLAVAARRRPEEEIALRIQEISLESICCR